MLCCFAGSHGSRLDWLLFTCSTSLINIIIIIIFIISIITVDTSMLVSLTAKIKSADCRMTQDFPHTFISYIYLFTKLFWPSKQNKLINLLCAVWYFRQRIHESLCWAGDPAGGEGPRFRQDCRNSASSPPPPPYCVTVWERSTSALKTIDGHRILLKYEW